MFYSVEDADTAFTLRSEEIKIHCNGCDKIFSL